MRRGLAAAACAAGLFVAAGCGGDDDGERHPSVPAALTAEEYCTSFEMDVLTPIREAGEVVATAAEELNSHCD